MLEKNLRRLADNVKSMRAQVDALRDPRTAEGAYNLFRESALTSHLDALYTLLDAGAKAALDDAAAAEVAPPAEGSTELDPWLKLVASSDNGRELFDKAWSAGLLGSVLPSTAADRIARAVRNPEGSVTIRTAAGKETLLTRGDKDIWRLHGVSAWIAAQPKPAPPAQKAQHAQPYCDHHALGQGSGSNVT
jgi:hypothetical protein